jgi:hypothetical protein
MTSRSLIAFLLTCWPLVLSGETVLRTVSTRADMVTGGEVLVEVSGLRGGETIVLDQRDITAEFRSGRDAGVRTGLVHGLPLGRSVLQVLVGRKAVTQLELTNFASTGPVFSGPQQKPLSVPDGSGGPRSGG